MKFCIVTPARAGSRSGNRMTAARWARILRGLGHRVVVTTSWDGQECDALIALHAKRSAASVVRWRRDRAGRPVVVVLTGTDQYVDLPRGSLTARASLDAATRIVALHEHSRAALPAAWRRKTRVVVHSEPEVRGRSTKAPRGFPVVQLAHLRPVKEPFLAAKAVRLLPADSLVRVTLAGEALSPGMARRAARESRENPRWRWIGSVPRAAALRMLRRARLSLITSRAEGSPGVVAEALAAGTPVLATRIDGVVGVLGSRHPGLFPPGDAAALAALLRRAEEEPNFLRTLVRAGERRRRLATPARERAALRSLVDELERDSRAPSTSQRGRA